MRSISLYLLLVVFYLFTHHSTGKRNIPMANYLYRNFLDVSTVNHFTAEFRGQLEVFVGLFDLERIVYQIRIKKREYAIRECLNDATCAETTYVVDTTFNAATFSPFWFRWEMNQVEFGSGLVWGLNRIGVHQTNGTIDVRYWAASGSPWTTNSISYHDSAKFLCYKGYRLAIPSRPQIVTARSLAHCAKACERKPFCFAVNYRPDGYDNCLNYVSYGVYKNEDVLVPFNITVNSEWKYCHMSKR